MAMVLPLACHVGLPGAKGGRMTCFTTPVSISTVKVAPF
jgi:hypothetical protein